MESGTIKVVAALICDDAGRVLLVRKRGTTAFMQPGGKRDPGEDDIAALSREVAEELGCRLVPASIQPLGEFDAVAANEPGWRVQASLYGIDVTGDIAPSQEIDETVWIDPAAPPDILLAPLTREHVLPLASMRRSRELPGEMSTLDGEIRDGHHLGLAEPSRDTAQFGLLGNSDTDA